MAAHDLSCPKCHGAIPAPAGEGRGVAVCPRCRTRAEFEAFPALLAGPRIGRPGEALVDASEASCFFHAEKRAVIACESCGRFLCALCDLEMEGRHICPTCLAAGRKKGALKNLDQFRVMWPGVALLMTIVLPLAFYPFTPLFALGALIVAFVGMRQPGSITGRRKILLYVIAIVFAVAELVGSVYLGKTLFTTFTGASRLK
jgi:hypothetical protein